MILHGIKAQNFMSLRDCTIDKFDEHLNFLVGQMEVGLFGNQSPSRV